MIMSPRTYTKDGLIVIPRNTFISPEEAIKNPSLLETILEKMNGIEDIERKDEELWKYFTYNERDINVNCGPLSALAFGTGILFTFSILEMANEPDPLTKLKEDTNHKYNEQINIYPNPSDYIRNIRGRIKSENPIFYEVFEFLSECLYSTEVESSSYNTGVFGTYELLRLAV